jgi:hypothetical protein
VGIREDFRDIQLQLALDLFLHLYLVVAQRSLRDNTRMNWMAHLEDTIVTFRPLDCLKYPVKLNREEQVKPELDFRIHILRMMLKCRR